MALVYPNEKSPSYKTWGTVNLSTNADGITGADYIDMTGYTLSALQPSTGCSSACTYTLKGNADGTTVFGALYTSSGALWSFGSTLIDPRGQMFSQDPAFFCGVRMLQVLSNTTSAAAPNATGATMKIILSAYGQIK